MKIKNVKEAEGGRRHVPTRGAQENSAAVPPVVATHPAILVPQRRYKHAYFGTVR
jgi:hypothetical protein